MAFKRVLIYAASDTNIGVRARMLRTTRAEPVTKTNGTDGYTPLTTKNRPGRFLGKHG